MISEEKKKVLELFSEGRRHYKLMKFSDAQAFFVKALEIDPQDGPSKEYLERCRQYIQNPPPEDWDGVRVMETK
ncbi:MAG: tetratricopeptide repeat protein [Spirochaetales bacterium]|nr:tetratricopeptide repeat protein [Spirochaetales bacterium]